MMPTNSSDLECNAVQVISSYPDSDAVSTFNAERYDEVSSSSIAAAMDFAKLVGQLKTTPHMGWL